MADYIDREKIFPNGQVFLVTTDTEKCINMLLQKIMETPTADVVEVKHAEWERLTNPFLAGMVCCSQCRDVYIEREWLDDGKWNYCPNCGAKMDGATE